MALPCCALGDLTHLTNPYVANILRSTPYILASHDLGKKCAVLCTNLVNYLMDSTSPLAHHLGWNPHAGTEDVPASNHVIQTAIEDVSSGVTWPITAHRHIWWFQWFPKKITTTKNEFQTTNHSFMIHIEILFLCVVFQDLKGSCHWQTHAYPLTRGELHTQNDEQDSVACAGAWKASHVGWLCKKSGCPELNLLGQPCQLVPSITTRAWGLCPS